MFLDSLSLKVNPWNIKKRMVGTHKVLTNNCFVVMQKISREESANFFGEVVPKLCGLLLQLPSMLEKHYQKADHVLDGVTSGLRLLGPQEAGIVLLSQVYTL